LGAFDSTESLGSVSEICAPTRHLAKLALTAPVFFVQRIEDHAKLMEAMNDRRISPQRTGPEDEPGANRPGANCD
jgi:hypothetical protein